MQIHSRRTFLGASALAAAASGVHADPLGMPIGCQTYPIRDALGKDVEGTLKQLASIGYRTIELCSPPGYEKAGYAPLLNISRRNSGTCCSLPDCVAKAATTTSLSSRTISTSESRSPRVSASSR